MITGIKVNSITTVPLVASVFKEGVYHFDTGSGKNLYFVLTIPDKPVTLLIIKDESNNLKYYLKFDSISPRENLSLDYPLPKHTTVLVGEGELAFTFSD